MKRSPMPPRREWMRRSTKPLPQVNPRQQAARQERYKAYLSSPAWRARRKEALERAGHRCEEHVRTGERCPETKRLTVHHRTYARFGAELPKDLTVLCKAHHDAHHAAQRIKPRALRGAA